LRSIFAGKLPLTQSVPQSRGPLYSSLGGEHVARERGAALAQPIPLAIAVDQDATPINNAIQKKRRPGLHPLEMGNIDPATADDLQTDGQSPETLYAHALQRATPTAKTIDHAIDLGVEGNSPYPEHAAFIDAESPHAGREITRAFDEAYAVVLVSADERERVITAKTLAGGTRTSPTTDFVPYMPPPGVEPGFTA